MPPLCQGERSAVLKVLATVEMTFIVVSLERIVHLRNPRGAQTELKLISSDRSDALAIDIHVFNTDYTEARNHVFVIGDHALIMYTRNKLRHGYFHFRCHGFEHIPKSTFYPYGCRMSVNAECALFWRELLDLIGRTNAKNVIQGTF